MKARQILLAAATFSVASLFSSCAFQPGPYAVAGDPYPSSGGYYAPAPVVSRPYYASSTYYGDPYYDPYYSSVYSPTLLVGGSYWHGSSWNRHNHRHYNYRPRPGHNHGSFPQYPHRPGGGGGSHAGHNHGGGSYTGNPGGSWNNPPRSGSVRPGGGGGGPRIQAVQSSGRPQMMQPTRQMSSQSFMGRGSGGGGSRTRRD